MTYKNKKQYFNMNLEQFKTYKISELRPDDRFHFASDKNKKVWQVVELSLSFNNFRYCIIENDYKQRRTIKQNKDVVFLRNN